MPRLLRFALACLVCSLTSLPLRAQEPPAPDDAAPDPFAEIVWESGPTTVKLGEIAEIAVPDGYAFTGKEGTNRFLVATQNPPSGDELGLLIPSGTGREDFWFAVFEFKDVGYVKDDERDALDADALLATLKEGNVRGNEARKARGWNPIELTGWEKAPFYDTRTQNLTWALRLKSSDGESVNYSTRLLGRGGYMNVDLVLSPGALDASLPGFETALAGFAYVPGQKYAEFKAGDRIAEYGLAALVAGGVGAALVKTGLLQKFWKVIVAGLIGAAAVARRLFARLFSGGEMKMPPPSSGEPTAQG